LHRFSGCPTIDGVTVTVAHVRLCHSLMMFVRAYPHEAQEMVFDAHDMAFAFFGGAGTRGLRQHEDGGGDGVRRQGPAIQSTRFLQMCSHYLIRPVACTPASGWEKGQGRCKLGLHIGFEDASVHWPVD
jgi:transposase